MSSVYFSVWLLRWLYMYILVLLSKGLGKVVVLFWKPGNYYAEGLRVPWTYWVYTRLKVKKVIPFRFQYSCRFEYRIVSASRGGTYSCY